MKEWCCTSDSDTQAKVSSVTSIGFHNELQITVRTKKNKERGREDSEEGLNCNLALIFGVPNGAFFDVDQLKSMEGILEVWVKDNFSVDVEQPSFTSQAYVWGLVYKTSTSTTSYAIDEYNNEMTRFKEVSLTLPVHLRYPCPGNEDYVNIKVNLQAVELKCDKSQPHQVQTTPFSFINLASAPHMQCTVPLLVPAGRIHHAKFVKWATPFVAVVGAVLLIFSMWRHPISHHSTQDSESTTLLIPPEKKKNK